MFNYNRIWLVVGGLAVAGPAWGQGLKHYFAPPDSTPYALTWRRSLPVAGGGGGALLAGTLVTSQLPPLTPAQLAALRRTDLWPLDRPAVDNRSVAAARGSDALLIGTTALPLLALAHPRTRRDAGRIVLMQAQTGLLAVGLVALTKPLVRRPRPFAYNPALPLAERQTTDARQSFFSGHVATVAAMSFFTATTFAHYFPDSRLRPWVWTYAVAAPALTGYLRWRAGNHFVTDVLVGYAVGAATGVLVPALHQRLRRHRRR